MYLHVVIQMMLQMVCLLESTTCHFMIFIYVVLDGVPTSSTIKLLHKFPSCDAADGAPFSSTNKHIINFLCHVVILCKHSSFLLPSER